MNRIELHDLTRMRINEGKSLLDAELYAGSYYLSGYAVECGLKAAIAKQQGRNEFPDKRLANECNTHNLRTLVRLAGLQLELEEEIRSSAAFAENWSVVRKWSEIARYEVNVPAQTARCMYVACAGHLKGVLPWIQKHW
ncbi:hypothetical protein SAMN05518865_107209 [Duganella sp. CF458]|uniref:hypothetical protein n=1 Tax=Duganella sp. CF458 TaxID=1884368 RepID=UPI0008EAA912|nr:hypothetical protein [Duganella sp. CF458]SFG03163.1 hypothetical protein SAMN05518865_107209 [Duganella sp. CF458]